MALLLSKSELAQTEPADRAAFESPVPTQIVSNGEFNPLPQTAQQRRVEERIKELADAIAPKLGLDRRQFLRTGSGMAAAAVDDLTLAFRLDGSFEAVAARIASACSWSSSRKRSTTRGVISLRR